MVAKIYTGDKININLNDNIEKELNITSGIKQGFYRLYNSF